MYVQGYFFTIESNEFDQRFKDLIGTHNEWEDTYDSMHLDEKEWEITLVKEGDSHTPSTYKIVYKDLIKS
jgi:hypothetical protein